MYMCGFIPDKEDSMIGEIVIEDDYLNQIKEDRLIKMLTCEAFETDERWLLYDDEEVEVQTEVSELVFNQLLEETIRDLLKIKTRPKKTTTVKSGSITKNSDRPAPTDSSNPFFENRSNMVEEIIMDTDFASRSDIHDGFKGNHLDTPRSTKSYNSQIQPRPSRETHKHELSNRSRFSNHAFQDTSEAPEDKFAKNKSDLVKKRVLFNSRSSDRASQDRSFTDEAKERFDAAQVKTVDSFEPELSSNLNNTPVKGQDQTDLFQNFEDLKNEDFSNLKNDRERIMESPEQNSPFKSESSEDAESEASDGGSYDESEDFSDSLYPIGPPMISDHKDASAALKIQDQSEPKKEQDLEQQELDSHFQLQEKNKADNEEENLKQNSDLESCDQNSLASTPEEGFDQISGQSFPQESSMYTANQPKMSSLNPEEGQQIATLEKDEKSASNQKANESEKQDQDLEFIDNQILVTQSSKESAQKPISNIDDFFSKNSQDSISKNYQDDEEEQHLNISSGEIGEENAFEEVKKSMPNLHRIDWGNIEQASPQTGFEGKLGGALMEQLKLSLEPATESELQKANQKQTESNQAFFQAAGNIDFEISAQSLGKNSSKLSETGLSAEKQDLEDKPLETGGTDDFGDIDFVEDFGGIDDDPFLSNSILKQNKPSSPALQSFPAENSNTVAQPENRTFEREFDDFEFGQADESNPPTESTERKVGEGDIDFIDDFDDFDF